MKKNNIIVIIRVALAIAVWWIIYKGYIAFVEPLFADSMPEALRLVISSMIVPYTVGLGLSFLLVKGMEDGELSGDLDATPGLIGKAFLVQTGLALPIVFIVNIILRIFGVTKVGMTADTLFGSNWLFYVILLLLFNPIFEELLFRKLALDKLLVLGETPAIIISSVFFALPHIYSQGIPLFFGTFIAALIWAYVRVKTGKMWPVILLHSLFNIYGSYFVLGCSSTIPTSMLYMFLTVIVMPVAGIITLVIHFKSHTKESVPAA